MLINAYIFFYGGTKREAREKLKQFSEEMKIELIKGYKAQIYKMAYND